MRCEQGVGADWKTVTWKLEKVVTPSEAGGIMLLKKAREIQSSFPQTPKCTLKRNILEIELEGNRIADIQGDK